MALNTAHTDGGVLIHLGEVILLHAKSTVLSFTGSDDLKQYSKLNGNCYLTTHRLIFLGKDTKSPLKSFSFPFCVLTEVDVEQPVFGANFLKGKVRAQENGNWRGEAKFKILFNAGGAIDFAQGMKKAITIARQTTSHNPMWNAPPPDYGVATGMAAPAPASYYSGTSNYYGWTAPTTYAFPAPEAGSVYIMEAPPPYPGIGGTSQQIGFASGVQQQGYIPPAYVNGNQGFMTPPPYSAVAPGSDGGKKFN